MGNLLQMIQVPIETDPRGYWFDDLIKFKSYADAVKTAYPGQYTEIPGAVILELEHELCCTICGEGPHDRSS